MTVSPQSVRTMLATFCGDTTLAIQSDLIRNRHEVTIKLGARAAENPPNTTECSATCSQQPTC
eukprot:6347825-Amphidinium_carterae.1